MHSFWLEMMVSDVVVMPKRVTGVEELAGVVRAAGEAGEQVRVSGSGAGVAAKLEDGRVVREVSMLRMNKVIEHAVGDMTVIVEAGISLEALQRKLAWANQWLPVDPPAVARRAGMGPGQRTIGGLIASNALGPLRMGCGNWRLLVMGMKWVDGRGNVIKGGGRTVKNVAGYSTPRMMIGACGSLGLIAEVTLRTFARPADEQCVIFFCESAERAEALVAAVMQAPVTPAYVQVVGGRTFSGNPLGLPTMEKGVAVVIGFLDRSANCAAQVGTVRGLAEAKGVDGISQTAAQAGRLRLWMTTEPAVETLGNREGMAFRMGVLSSEACAVVAEIEKAAEGAWVVSEAAAGVVRGVVAGAAVAAPMVNRVTEGASFYQTQGAVGGSNGEGNTISARLKRALDPMRVFGRAPLE